MTFATLDALADHLEVMGQYSAAYWDKMMHEIPPAPSVERLPWLQARCQGKTVVHLGCEGPLHAALQPVCSRLYGVDRVARQDTDYAQVDLDWCADDLPTFPGVELVLAAEILEHLCNPGFLLKMVQTLYPGVPLIVTTPNAFAPQPKLLQGIEQVNADHTCWFSWWTLKTLLAKCGYVAQEWAWYHGKPLTAEGLIVVAH